MHLSTINMPFSKADQCPFEMQVSLTKTAKIQSKTAKIQSIKIISSFSHEYHNTTFRIRAYVLSDCVGSSSLPCTSSDLKTVQFVSVCVLDSLETCVGATVILASSSCSSSLRISSSCVCLSSVSHWRSPLFSSRAPLSGEVVGGSVFFSLAFKLVESRRESGVRSAVGRRKAVDHTEMALLLHLAKRLKLKDRGVQAKCRYHVVLEGQ